MCKRNLSLFLSVLLFLLSGCASSQKNVPVESVSTVTTETTSPALPTEEQHPDDWYAVHTLVNLFAAEYFRGSRESLKSSLADDFEGKIELYYDYYAPEEVSPTILTIKGLDAIGEMEIGDLCYPSIEFVSGLADDDSYTYLSMVLIKQDDGWKVLSYGLEK